MKNLFYIRRNCKIARYVLFLYAFAEIYFITGINFQIGNVSYRNTVIDSFISANLYLIYLFHSAIIAFVEIYTMG